MFTVDEAVNFGFFEGEELVSDVMTGNKFAEVNVQLECVNGVAVSQF